MRCRKNFRLANPSRNYHDKALPDFYKVASSYSSSHTMSSRPFSLYLFLYIFSNILFLISTEEWHHCTTLDSKAKFHVCWRVEDLKDDQEIEFKVEVEAHGYVGLGLSPNGGMTSSDIVTGWIRNGKVYFQDRYAEGNFLPKIDEIQNWNLVSGSENDTHSVLIFRRKLDTCDNEDRKIDDSTTRLIYAYSDIDPPSEYALDYHFKNRGSKSVYLLQRKMAKHVNIDKSSLSHWDVLSPNFTLDSSFQTMYWCKIHKAPELTEKHHIVLVEPLIQEGNEAFVHHLLLYECVGANRKEYEPHLDQYGHQCHRSNMPDAMKKCEGVSLAWGIGGDDLLLPEDVGLPLESIPAKYYMLEVHYDNPNKVAGIVDSSGFRIYYSPKLRKYDAGTLMIGSTTSARVIVPSKRKEYVVAGHSNPRCLDPELPKDGIKLLGAFLHAHLLGRHLKARHFRNSIELKPLADDGNYDFNYQGGESTREEMCLVFLLYYPRIERFASVSVPKYDTINKALGTDFTKDDLKRGTFREQLSKYDWNKVNILKVENSLRYGLHDTHCYLGNGTKNSIKAPISYPDIKFRYEEASKCEPEQVEEENNDGQKLRCDFTLYLSIFISFYVIKLRE
ncbi:unnamed protein product [Larinioides sclopetarius]|uniref:DOMON domain-containing protein n=1 Tax=Larinioides sclopetarius TaxID=280406 RepID=A0AAV2BGT1_9ARAC